MAGLTIGKANEIVDDIVHKLKVSINIIIMWKLLIFLQDDFQRDYRFNVSEVIKGGSLGHGTAVPEKFDLDLVLYSRGNPNNY